MKLCRFDLFSSPGQVRSGVLYSGRMYETDGNNPIAVYESGEARLLSPVGLAPSVRLFEPWTSESDWAGMLEGKQAELDLSFAYLNAANIVGPMTELAPFHLSEDIGFVPCIAAVVSSAGTHIAPEDAESHILGVSMLNVFCSNDLLRMERVRGVPPGRSHDVGMALGPVITTPDELEETTIQDLSGRRYRMEVSARVNDAEVFRSNTDDLPMTLAQAVCFASESSPVRPGDVIAIALGLPNLKQPLQSGDDVRMVCDWLGTLASRVG